MSFYIRKSKKLGSLRLNLSKSGVGASVGATGLRTGIKPNGQKYVHAGRHGIYYRKNIGNNTKANGNYSESPKSKAESKENITNKSRSDSSSPSEYKNFEENELLKIIEKANKQFSYSGLFFGCIIVISFILIFQSLMLGLGVFFIGLFLFSVIVT